MKFMVGNKKDKLYIEGENLIDAIETNFRAVAEKHHVGNSAGYQLVEVHAEYDQELYGGEGGVALTVRHYGSDALVRYDYDEPMEETIIPIQATLSDLPERYDFEIKRSTRFDPFADDWRGNGPVFTYGVILGLIIELSSHVKYDGSPDVYDSLMMRSPTMKKNHPVDFFNRLYRDIQTRYIKRTPETKRLMDRIDQLWSDIAEDIAETKDMGLEGLGRHKTYCYFRCMNNLLELREQAGKTQSEVSEKAKMPIREYQKYENRELDLHYADITTIMALARALGTTPKVVSPDHPMFA